MFKVYCPAISWNKYSSASRIKITAQITTILLYAAHAHNLFNSYLLEWYLNCWPFNIYHRHPLVAFEMERKYTESI